MNVEKYLAEKNIAKLHYYGDIVRRIFLGSGTVLLLAILFDQEFLSFYLYVGVFSVLALVVLAGLTNPRSESYIKADAIASGILFLLFEYLAISGYKETFNFSNPVFLIRQLLAILFLFALYFSVKTLRGMIVAKSERDS